jgi:heat shock protein HslJ
VIGNIAATQKACADPTVMNLEAEYFAILGKTIHVTVTADSLTLVGENETPLAIFTKK